MCRYSKADARRTYAGRPRSTRQIPARLGYGRRGQSHLRQFSRKVEVRSSLEAVLTPEGLAVHRREYLDAIRAYNAEGRPTRAWPIQFLIRRTAHHVMDHAWELEDRDLSR